MSKTFVLGEQAAEDFRGMRAAYNAERADKRPPRRRPVVAPASRPKLAIFDGSRSGKRYTGHLLDPETGGASDTAVQWFFLNDDGSEDEGIIEENDLVILTMRCPPYLADSGSWLSSIEDKYLVAPVGGTSEPSTPVARVVQVTSGSADEYEGTFVDGIGTGSIEFTIDYDGTETIYPVNSIVPVFRLEDETYIAPFVKGTYFD